jgi:hypothetical protein
MGSGADRPSAVAWRTTREWWKDAGEGQHNEAPLAAQGLHPCLGKAWRARHGEAIVGDRYPPGPPEGQDASRRARGPNNPQGYPFVGLGRNVQ